MTFFSRKNMLFGLVLMAFLSYEYVNARLNKNIDYDPIPKKIGGLGFGDDDDYIETKNSSTNVPRDIVFIGVNDCGGRRYVVDSVDLGDVGSSWSVERDNIYVRCVIKSVDYVNRQTVVDVDVYFEPRRL